MKSKLFIPVLTFAIFIVYIQLIHPSSPVITYFPPTKDVEFSYAHTKLIPPVDASMEGNYRVDWTSTSKSSEEVYLRQDVSLLFYNGCLAGAQSSWREKTAALKMTEYPNFKGNSLLESISFHYGEIHEKQDKIKAIQMMTKSKLYIKAADARPFTLQTFEIPTTDEENDFQKKIDSKVKQDLLYYWNNLASELNIDLNDYTTIPLASLANYEDKALPGLNKRKSAEVISKLWEGLYKQYIIKVLTEKNPQSCMPLILIKKDNKQLQVIYKLNGQTEQLLQKIRN